MNKSKLYIGALLMSFAAINSTNAQTDDNLKRQAWAWIDSQTQNLSESNQRIWSYAETGLEEHRSSEELQRLLGDSGFEVEAGVAGMPTAFVATYGQGRPVIGILAEFDALPGVSQAATPTPGPGPNPAAGHACGHSVFGVGSTAAAIAVKNLIAEGELEGTIKLYGTPAEETVIGKIYMLREGYFKNDDVILTWHAGDRNAAGYASTKALVNVKFRFSGVAAHASRAPFAGRSALDAVELMNVGVNYMREHVMEDARIHYVITNGGGQPNVVPPEAEVWYYIRANEFDDVVIYFDWIKEIAEGAAKMTRTTLEAIEVQSEVHQLLPTRAMSELMHENLTAVGPAAWTAQELTFTRRTQEVFGQTSGIPYAGDVVLHTEIEPLPDEIQQGPASTDVADISWFVPIGNLRVASFGYGIPTHTWPVVASTGTSIGTKALIIAGKTLAASAIDLYTDSALLEAVKLDWREIRADRPWKTLIPEGQAAPEKVR